MITAINSNISDPSELLLQGEEPDFSIVEGMYLHYTGLVVNVECTCTDIESFDEYALVTALGNDSKKWCVPLRNFHRTININGRTVRRFQPVFEEELPELEAVE